MLSALPDYPIDYTPGNDPMRRRHLPALAVVALLFVVGGLALMSWHHHVSSIDRNVTAQLVQREGSSAFAVADDVSILASGPAVGAFALLFGAFVWLRTSDVRAASLAPVASVVAGIVESIGKVVVGHPRPLTATLTGESGFGFPSGHTTGFTALVLAVCATLALLKHPNGHRWTGWPIALAAAALIAVSRVLVGAHYAFDVLAGLATGSLSAIATVHLLPNVWGRVDRVVGRLAQRTR